VGALCGIFAFTCVIFSEPLLAPNLFRIGAFLIGFGGGLFAVSTLATAMSFDSLEMNGLVIGAWGAVSASAAGLAIGLGGVIRDLVSSLAVSGALGSVLVSPGTGYSFVFVICNIGSDWSFGHYETTKTSANRFEVWISRVSKLIHC
jgi:BCD family chlorophyll transporter-like MFS transporter